MQKDSDASRVLREQQFHDARFTEETRGREEKFYAALSDAFRFYWDLVTSRSAGRDVLEYGCAAGDNCLRLAPAVRSFVGIDISNVAISQAREKAAARGFDNTQFECMNAEAMSFPNGRFDFIFGSGILHHLDLSRSLSELRRVLRPGGSCVFMEPLGHNPLINLYRRVTPNSRTPDEHPLLRDDFAFARKSFGNVQTEFFALTQLAAVPFRNTPLNKLAGTVTRAIDKQLLKLPFFRWQAWTVVMILEG